MDHYAVLGNPVKHSLSPKIHQLFSEQTGQLISYQSIEVPVGDFNHTVKQLIQQGYKGVNITAPFKTEAFQLAQNTKHSKVTPAAAQAGAANTLVFHDDDTITADTTDGIGLVTDLTQNHRIELHEKAVLILGAGGAVRSVLSRIVEEKPSKIIIANRTLTKASALADQYPLVTGTDLNNIPLEAMDIIINGTSTSLTTDASLLLPDHLVTKNTCCYEMTYGRSTWFLDWAKAHQARGFDGIGMLVEQAAAAFYLWRGVYPKTKAVIDVLNDR